uniref:DNA damage-binding protein 1 n=1 Tax=Dunaliella tertiolecta TaxID=3047 RepID=A0A7S3VLT8_DUNTE|mmetsp:Transcript_22766/g.62913  ORF Transcript_22766/g.62913 Transcript_22766/m.62913 type:complete len:1207 (-) Transcript_22766:224-3844(-)|eukprot:CAMPEP_0202354154 /NCGR_PEP_ID=MMETSP1126-20121109/9600_1 /ASSEMBLY_ACC=CAM_ASM_000457 /TAXON_ID=3047 /ORGANISM="Dunaliella tertiolecta, Strain CCMP1320" /LENGTH=1206 /DNA_ID=CAMNT_0048946589 /DNA_START=181 /DNA_END=3804 /DNA_ORIENTATION=+
MHLYHLTLSRPSGVQTACYGNFSGPKAQEVVVSRGKVLELLRPNEMGKLVTVVSTEVFGCIRALAPFRITGASTDYVIVGSDSGRIVVLQYDNARNVFKKVHQETYGKSGCRRLVPGQFLTCDPKGRACMIASIEKQKFVYVLNRDNAANLTISSPLEAHKSNTIVFSIVGMDCGFDNPVFAAIELDYREADQDWTGEAASVAQKQLTFYELDLGLNHVVRKWSDPVDNGANMLIPVPGGADGPGGVLVCAENFIIYKNQDHEEVRAVIPRRNDLPGDRGVLIVSYASHKKKAYSFFLVQSEYGDIYKVTLEAQQETVTAVKVKYFDTVPPCASIAVLKTGFLFAASEYGNHALYQFIGTGEDEEDVESSSATLVQTEEGFQPVFFDPRPLKNLLLVDELPSLMPILDMKVANLLGEEIPQIYALTGRGPRSALAVLRPGLAVTELAASPLPGNPTAVFTVKHAMGDEFDAYIVVSFTNATLVFSIGEEVKETNDSGFLGTVPTLHTQLLADNSLLQVHPGGLRHIRPDRRINEWKVPGRRQITRATTNEHQVAIALGGDVIYFELDPMGQLLEAEKKEMGDDVACLDIAPVPEGRARCRFLAVGCYDSTVRVLGLDPEDGLKGLALQALPAIPESLLMLYGGADEGGPDSGLFLQVALQNGVLMRTEVDRVSGQLTDPRSRFLGTRPPRLFPVSVRGHRSMLALSSRPWLGFSDHGRFSIIPLSYEALDYAAGFASDQCPEGFVAVSKGSLRILAVENVGETFNQQVTRLRYTPRRLAIHPTYNTLFVAEADHAAIPLAEREDVKERLQAEGGMDSDAVQGIEFDEDMAALEEQFGTPRGQPGQWAACLRIVDPATLSTAFVVELDNNEGIQSMCLAPLASPSATNGAVETMLVVGTAQGLRYYPTECDAAYLRVYRILDAGRRLELLHKTQVDGGPVGALCAFKNRLLAGCGSILRLYELGKKKMLRKCEYKQLPHYIASLHASGSRIYVGDSQESVHFMKYKKADNHLYIFADDASPRYVTSVLPLDYDTLAVADKFGNVGVLRLPPDVSAQVEEDPTGGKLASTSGRLNGAPHKLAPIINFHVGDTVTSLQRAALQPGGQEVIVYGTAMGGIGAFYPFSSREDADFFTHLEMHMRQEHPPLCGRDHMAFRSAYWPVKDCVDGDLCAQYPSALGAKQRSMAEELDRTPGEVLKKLEDIRNKIL